MTWTELFRHYIATARTLGFDTDAARLLEKVLMQRALKAEARARELEEMIAWERLKRIEAEGTPF